MMANKEIIIPHELIDLNNYVNAERANRFQGAKLKKKYTKLCALAVKSAINQGLAVTEIDMTVDLHFTWDVPSKRKDKDNIDFAKKCNLDGML